MGTDNRDNIHINSKNRNNDLKESFLKEEIASIMRYEADDDDEEIDEEELRLEEEHFKEYQARITKRIDELKAEHDRQLRKIRFAKAGAIAVLLVLVGVFAFNTLGYRFIVNNSAGEAAAAAYSSQEEAVEPIDIIDYAEDYADAAIESSTEEDTVYVAMETADTKDFGSDIISTYGLLMNADTLEILSERNAYEKMYPASMTKVLTLLVAAENLTEQQLDDTFEITIEITDYSYSHDCSAAGFDVGENVPVRDLLYALILPSGADGALGLAYYIAGSQEAFVDMMNEKAKELGIADSAHFTNCIGLYDEDHYCTAYDMAIIMRAAIDNDLCKEILSTHYYVTSSTKEHPDGIALSNWFLRRIEDNDKGINVVCGKTGYVIQSGSCAVSYAEDDDGNSYILCTGNSTSSWKCIGDHVALYASAMSVDNTTEYTVSASQSNSGGIDEE